MQAVVEKKQAVEMAEISLKLPQPFFFVVKVNGYKFTDEDLRKIDADNEDLRIETNANGDLEIMPPPFLEASRKNADINVQLGNWAKKDKTGIAFESDGMFTFPNGAKRAPDAFWILKERYFALSKEEREEKFARICSDFVIELRSKSDNLRKLQAKMREYIENGARLGWLIDPTERRVHIYRRDKRTEVLENPKTISGEDVLRGFELDLTEIWQ